MPRETKMIVCVEKDAVYFNLQLLNMHLQLAEKGMQYKKRRWYLHTLG